MLSDLQESMYSCPDKFGIFKVVFFYSRRRIYQYNEDDFLFKFFMYSNPSNRRNMHLIKHMNKEKLLENFFDFIL